MRKLILSLAIVALCQVSVFGQKKYEMVVEKTDGTEATFQVEDIKRVYFREQNNSGGGQTEEPSVSYTSCPDTNHPHWIDLGLPSGTQWRCCNEGASAPEGYGGYYTFDQAQAYNLPSRDQTKELVDNCSYAWTTQNGVKGGKITGPNGGTIFLPAAGYVWGGELRYVGYRGEYWSSTPIGEYNVYDLYFGSGGEYRDSYSTRSAGQSVRPVR